MSRLPAMSLKSKDKHTADKLIRTLEKKIYSGELKDGEMFPAERALVEEFGVSRTVVRETVKILGTKGLIDIRPRYRPIIKQPNFNTAVNLLSDVVLHLTTNQDGVKNLFDVRIFVEKGLVRQASLTATKNDLIKLEKALQKNGDSINSSVKFYNTDMAFHHILYTISQNPVFPALHKNFCLWLERYWKKMPRLSERNKRNYLAHEAIFLAIAEQNPDKAEEMLESHLDDSWLQVKNMFFQ